MKAGADTVAPLSSVTCLSTPDTVDPFATSSAAVHGQHHALGGADAQHLALVHHELVDIALDQELRRDAQHIGGGAAPDRVSPGS